MSKFCTQCGKPLADNSKFCTACGKSVAVSTSGTNGTLATSSAPVSPPMYAPQNVPTAVAYARSASQNMPPVIPNDGKLRMWQPHTGAIQDFSTGFSWGTLFLGVIYMLYRRAFKHFGIYLAIMIVLFFLFALIDQSITSSRFDDYMLMLGNDSYTLDQKMDGFWEAMNDKSDNEYFGVVFIWALFAAHIIYAAVFNKMYINDCVENGYSPIDENSHRYLMLNGIVPDEVRVWPERYPADSFLGKYGKIAIPLIVTLLFWFFYVTCEAVEAPLFIMTLPMFGMAFGYWYNKELVYIYHKGFGA